MQPSFSKRGRDAESQAIPLAPRLCGGLHRSLKSLRRPPSPQVLPSSCPRHWAVLGEQGDDHSKARRQPPCLCQASAGGAGAKLVQSRQPWGPGWWRRALCEPPPGGPRLLCPAAPEPGRLASPEVTQGSAGAQARTQSTSRGRAIDLSDFCPLASEQKAPVQGQSAAREPSPGSDALCEAPGPWSCSSPARPQVSAESSLP